jgi:hypothetical protein
MENMAAENKTETKKKKRKLVDYSIEDAVKEVLEEIPMGKTFLGYQLCQRVRVLLHIHGRDIYPMDSTILRRLREQKDHYGIKAKGGGISEYQKAVRVRV